MPQAGLRDPTATLAPKPGEAAPLGDPPGAEPPVARPSRLVAGVGGAARVQSKAPHRGTGVPLLRGGLRHRLGPRVAAASARDDSCGRRRVVSARGDRHRIVRIAPEDSARGKTVVPDARMPAGPSPVMLGATVLGRTWAAGRFGTIGLDPLKTVGRNGGGPRLDGARGRSDSARGGGLEELGRRQDVRSGLRLETNVRRARRHDPSGSQMKIGVLRLRPLPGSRGVLSVGSATARPRQRRVQCSDRSMPKHRSGLRPQRSNRQRRSSRATSAMELDVFVVARPPRRSLGNCTARSVPAVVPASNSH